MPIFPSCRDPSLKTDSLGASSLGLEGREGSPPLPKPASFRLVLPLNSQRSGVMSSSPLGILLAHEGLSVLRGGGLVPLLSSGSEPRFPDNGRAHLTSRYYQFNPSLNWERTEVQPSAEGAGWEVGSLPERSEGLCPDRPCLTGSKMLCFLVPVSPSVR